MIPQTGTASNPPLPGSVRTAGALFPLPSARGCLWWSCKLLRKKSCKDVRQEPDQNRGSGREGTPRWTSPGPPGGHHQPPPTAVFTFRSWQVGGIDNFSWLKNFKLCSLLQEALNQFTARMCACVLSYEQAEEHWPLRTFSYSCHMRASWDSPHQIAGWTRHPGPDV